MQLVSALLLQYDQCASVSGAQEMVPRTVLVVHCDETFIAMHACFETKRLSAPRTDGYNIHFPLLVKKKRDSR
jgi:hypothetical protein